MHETREAVPDAETRPAAPDGTAGRVRVALAWSTGLQIFRDLGQFGLTMTLTRLLPAEVYGQFGFLTTLLGFFTLYSFREFLGHTMQVRDGRDVHYQDHFTAGAVMQAIVVVAVNVVAIVFRFLPGYAPLAGVLHVMSLLFVLDLPSEFRVRMLERELDWRRLRVLQAVGFVASGAVSVALAFAGFGVVALIVPTLVVPLPFIYDLFVRERFRPTWAFSWSRFQPAWRFGWMRIATVSLVAAATLTEVSWMTSAIGFAAVGIYGRAMGLAQLVSGRLASLLSLSIYPVLTRLMPEAGAFKRVAEMYLRGIAWVVIPAGTMCAVAASPIVRFIYGPSWTGAVPLVPAAMAVAALLALVQTGYTLLLASGRQAQCLVADGWRLAGSLIALLVALPHGVRPFLLAMCVVHGISMLTIAGFLIAAGALRKRAVYDSLVPAIACTIPAFACAWLVQGAWFGWSLVVFGTTYAVCIRTFFAPQLAEVIGYLPHSARLGRWLGVAEWSSAGATS